MLNEGNQIHNFMSSSSSGSVINYGSGSGFDFLTSYSSGSGSGSKSQKVTVPTVPVPVPQHWFLPNFTGCEIFPAKERKMAEKMLYLICCLLLTQCNGFLCHFFTLHKEQDYVHLDHARVAEFSASAFLTACLPLWEAMWSQRYLKTKTHRDAK
jgi:hypothetical protein